MKEFWKLVNIAKVTVKNPVVVSLTHSVRRYSILDWDVQTMLTRESRDLYSRMSDRLQVKKP